MANDIGRVVLRTAEALPVDAYADSRRTGSFLLIDPADGSTLTAGMAGEAFAGAEAEAAVAEVPAKGRDTMGVVFARTSEKDRILAIARNGERRIVEELDEADPDTETPEESNDV